MASRRKGSILVTHVAEAVHFLHRSAMPAFALKVQGEKMLELPQFPGLLCKVAHAEVRLELVHYYIVMLFIEGFYRDEP